MQAALDAARSSETKRLYRWPGGYWMPRMRKENEASPHVSEYHRTLTVAGLIGRGYMKGVQFMRGGDPWVVEIVEPRDQSGA